MRRGCGNPYRKRSKYPAARVILSGWYLARVQQRKDYHDLEFNMLFSSTTFLYLFLPIVLFFYYVLLRKSRLLQNVFLLIASLFFYAWGEPKFVLVMLASITVNWLLGWILDKNRSKKKTAKALVALDVVFNLGILFVFKYLGFTGSIIERLFGVNLPIPDIALPIGISFFTFQAVSYIVDIKRERIEPVSNFLDFGFYLSFFPQLVAGPIVRAS